VLVRWRRRKSGRRYRQERGPSTVDPGRHPDREPARHRGRPGDLAREERACGDRRPDRRGRRARARTGGRDRARRLPS